MPLQALEATDPDIRQELLTRIQTESYAPAGRHAVCGTDTAFPILRKPREGLLGVRNPGPWVKRPETTADPKVR